MVRFAVLLSIALVALTACGSSSDRAGNERPDDAGHVISQAQLDNLVPELREASSSAVTITYASRNGVNDAVSHVTGTVFVPKDDPDKDGFPVVALGHRTAGTAADCAPSLSPDLRGEASTVVALLKAGYVVAVPDYQGLGKPSEPDEYDFHPYLDSTTAGYNMIDAVRAARSIVPEASTLWAALGAREGGQAAWAANELIDNYGYDLKLVATASLAPMANINGLADAAMAGTLTPEQKLAYVGFLAALKDQYYYDFELDNYRRGAAHENWDVMLACNDAARRMSLAARLSPDDLRPASPEALKTLRGYLQKTNLPQGPTAAPMYVIYGGRDAVVPAAWTDQSLIQACKMGDGIQIAFWPDQTRDQIEPVAALGWLNDRMKSIPAANDCPAYIAGHQR
ncbi:lipase family protein [Mycolicibacterium houstonense]|uniref:lipase family protein n=1 Tax=Mycolicibacterium houstonense TaxID=146021 RepID=UPI0008306393|nr:lipase family protein [Mycolicibacterium houstonense]